MLKQKSVYLTQAIFFSNLSSLSPCPRPFPAIFISVKKIFLCARNKIQTIKITLILFGMTLDEENCTISHKKTQNFFVN